MGGCYRGDGGGGRVGVFAVTRQRREGSVMTFMMGGVWFERIP